MRKVCCESCFPADWRGQRSPLTPELSETPASFPLPRKATLMETSLTLTGLIASRLFGTRCSFGLAASLPDSPATGRSGSSLLLHGRGWQLVAALFCFSAASDRNPCLAEAPRRSQAQIFEHPGNCQGFLGFTSETFNSLSVEDFTTFLSLFDRK